MSYGMLKNTYPDVIKFERIKVNPHQQKLSGGAWYCDYCETNKLSSLYLVYIDKIDAGCLCLSCLNKLVNEQLEHARRMK